MLVDSAGCIESEWASLVNPQRDVGPTRVHGLRGADLLDAPEFGEISDEILDWIAGRTVVAHNATFDMRFLYAELVRAGYSIRDRPPALCSMKWSGLLVGPAKLQHACDALGISLNDAHSALGDARATAALLPHLMNGVRDNHRSNWRHDVESSRSFSWPRQLGKPKRSPVLRGERNAVSTTWLDTVLNASWISGIPENEASYMLVLERALLDRVVSSTEAQELVAAAAAASLVGAAVARLHRNYLCMLAQEALSDGIVTAEERADLLEVAGALGLSHEDVAKALASATASESTARQAFSLSVGDRIVFTGEMSRPREEWMAAIVAVGLVSGGVTKSTRLVVAEDTDSLSGKAAKARQYGIPVINEDAFDRMFRAYCSSRPAH